MNLQRQIAAIIRSLPLIAAGALLAGLPVYQLVSGQPRVYEAESTVLVGQALTDANPDFLGLEVSRTLAGTYAWLAGTDGQLQRVIDTLGLDMSPDDLRSQIQATVREGDSVITISARDHDPVRAAAIADAVAAELIAAAPTAEDPGDRNSVESDLASLRADIDRAQSRLDDLLGLESPNAAQQAEIERLRAQLLALRSTYSDLLGYAGNGGANRLTLVQSAVVPTSSVEPRPLYFGLVAAVTGLLIAVALAFVLEWRDDRLRDGREIEEVTALPVLGAIPSVGRSKGGPVLYDVGSPAWDAADALRIGIESLISREELSSLTIVSPRSQEGRTTVAANLAVAFASAGRQVLLVDADLAHPRLHSVFGMEDRFGLTTIIRSDSASVDELALGTFVPGLRLLTSGRAPAEGGWRRAGGVEKVMERLSATPGELVIYDVPPLNVGTIALGLAARTDATLLVARQRKTPRSALRDAVSVLGLVRANVLGVAVPGLQSIPPASAEVLPVRQKAIEVETQTVAYGTPPRAG